MSEKLIQYISDVRRSALIRASAQGKTHGVVKFLLFLKVNINFHGVFLRCNVIVQEARVHSYAEECYITYQRSEADNQLICAANTFIKLQ